MTNENGCGCDRCGRYYKVDLIVSDDLWKKIDGDNLMLCGRCIMDRIEIYIGEFDAYQLVKL